MVSLFDFAHDSKLFRLFKVRDLLITEYKCLAEGSIFNIWSHLNYFVYVLNGKKEWRTIRTAYLVHAGEAVFVKKGANTIHKFFSEDFCAIIIFVPDPFIGTIVQQYPVCLPAGSEVLEDSVFPLTLDERLTACFQSMIAYFHQKDPPPDSLLELKFKELILTLMASSKNTALCRHFISLCHTSKPSIRDIMEENFAYHLAPEEYARLCARSLSTFKRDFISIYRMPPGKWLIKRRLEYSLHLLETTDKNINEIGFSSGFENTSHFIKLFRQAYQTTPHQYRYRNWLNGMEVAKL